MILDTKLFTFSYRDDKDNTTETLFDEVLNHRHVSLEISFMCFEVEWWCLGGAGYGATEFRINTRWFKAYYRKLMEAFK